MDADALGAELARLEALEDQSVLEVAYDSSRLARLARRQDFAMERVRATGAFIEVCPTSNRRIAGIRDPAHLPMHRFLAKALPVVVSSDDPAVFGTKLARELDWVCEQSEDGDGGRRQLVQSAWRARAESLAGRSSSHHRIRVGRRPTRSPPS